MRLPFSEMSAEKSRINSAEGQNSGKGQQGRSAEETGTRRSAR